MNQRQTTTLSIGFMSREDFRQHCLDLAAGRKQTKPDQPKILFDSFESFAKLLSADNRALLRLILEQAPQSLEELARLSHRKEGNLSRTLKKLAQHGLIRLHREQRRLVPEVVGTQFKLEFEL